MYMVKETPYFQREAAKIWRNEEREAFVDWISENPLAGDVIKEVGGLRKVRWSRSGVVSPVAAGFDPCSPFSCVDST